MSSSIKFTPILGSYDEGPVCYLLELDQIKILLDCGGVNTWTEDTNKLIKQYCSKVDLILLSHPILSHIGGYVNYYQEYISESSQPPLVYGTIPLQNMGRMCIIDWRNSQLLNKSNISLLNDSNHGSWSNQLIKNAFDHINTLRYSQPTNLTGPCNGITITAFGAGHTIGGTIWQIRKSTDVIVYAPDFNHRKERHLNGTVLLSNGAILDALYRPSLLITGALSSNLVISPRKKIENNLLEHLRSVLDNKGSTLLPFDSSARVLEILFLLDQLWAQYDIHYPIIFLTTCSNTTLKYAMSMLEWMGGNISEEFGITRENPFDFKGSPNIKLIHRYEDLDKFSGPKVIIASFDNMELGFSKLLFSQMAQDPNNSIVLTNKGLPDTLARTLYDLVKSKCDSKIPDTLIYPSLNEELTIEVVKKVPLEGKELAEFRYRERQQMEKEAEAAAILARSKHLMEEDDDDSSVDELDLDLNELLSRQFDIYIKDTTKLIGGTFKLGVGHKMFPYTERKRKFDDYGEEIVRDHYLTDLEQLTMKKEKVGSSGGQDEIDIMNREMEMYSDTQTTKFNASPMKAILEMVNIEIKCQVAYIGMEGRCDGRSLRTILKQVNPRKMILVHGSKKCTNDLRESLEADKGEFNSKIFTPKIGEILSVGTATKSLELHLSNSLLKHIQFYRFQDYEIGKIKGCIQVDTNEEQTDQMSNDSTSKRLNLTISKSSPYPNPTPIMIGDLRLTEFRTLLQQNGFHTEFQEDGALSVNYKLKVRKNAKGDLYLDGMLCKEYFIVRDLLYSRLAVL